MSAIANKLEASTHAKMDEISAAIAAECDEHALGALRETGKAIENSDGKTAQAFSQTLVNVVKVARTVRGLDSPQAVAPAVNLAFFLSAPSRAEPVNVTPAVTLPA